MFSLALRDWSTILEGAPIARVRYVMRQPRNQENVPQIASTRSSCNRHNWPIAELMRYVMRCMIFSAETIISITRYLLDKK